MSISPFRKLIQWLRGNGYPWELGNMGKYEEIHPQECGVIHWGEPEERQRALSQLGEKGFEVAYGRYAEEAAVMVVCGHKIVPLYDRKGRVEFHVLFTDRVFPEVTSAANYARSLPN